MTDVQPTGAVHPAAECFPFLAGDELQELVDDIAANGLRQPITLAADGVLLDGRNRLRGGDSAARNGRSWPGSPAFGDGTTPLGRGSSRLHPAGPPRRHRLARYPRSASQR